MRKERKMRKFSFDRLQMFAVFAGFALKIKVLWTQRYNFSHSGKNRGYFFNFFFAPVFSLEISIRVNDNRGAGYRFSVSCHFSKGELTMKNQNVKLGGGGAQGNLCGFTLVELLVVIAIIGVLIALLLPAVQAAREAARRSACINNLKQLAITMHNYHDTIRCFPPGNIALNQTPQQASWESHTMGWPAFILPWMEAAALYDQFSFVGTGTGWGAYTAVPTPNQTGGPGGGTLNEAVASMAPPAFACPSVPNVFPKGTYKDYSANGSARRNGIASFPERNIVDNVSLGIFYKGSSCTMGSIADGTSNTFMFVERSNVAGPRCNPQPTFTDGRELCFNPFFWVCDRSQGYVMTYQDGNPLYINSTSGVPCTFDQHLRSAASHHPAGIQVAFADGSCFFVAQTIHHDNIYSALMSKAFGEQASLP